VSEFNVGDTVYFPTAPSDFNRDTPYTVASLNPFTVTCELRGVTYGPYELTEHEVATCGMTRETQR